MLRSLLIFALCCWSIPAGAVSTDALYKQWDALRNPDRDAIAFDDGYRFLREHAGWPEEKLIRLRTEAAAMHIRPRKAVMDSFCREFPPISGRGMVACATAGVGTVDEQTSWVRQGWQQGDFNADEESRVRTAYDKWLTQADHLARMERLLYQGYTKAAKRMLPLVPMAKHPLYKARIALANNEPGAPKLLDHLSTHDRATAGIIFERLRWRMERDADADLSDLLLKAPADAPFPELWWPFRAAAVRDAIADGNDDRALAILKHAGDLKGEALSDALWIKGWLLLRHKGDAKTAYKQFFKLYTSVSTPVSKARAAYWAARAAQKNGNDDIAHEWLEKAARHPTVFYGQLAYGMLHPGAPLPLPAPITPSEEAVKKLNALELTRVARALAASGDERARDKFLSALAARTTRHQEYAALAALAETMGGKATGVEIAKLALRSGIVLLPQGWPTIAVPKDLPIEPALTLAITRQESEFDPKARSSADARGLMQLLPSTARQMAKKLDLRYQDALLWNPETNLTLGSHYLGRIINGFDGSYILGIASYNAGPSNVRKWIARRGTPPKTLEGAIDWVESIPFGETRNYVMRALENLNVYRTLADAKTPLALEQDLVR